MRWIKLTRKSTRKGAKPKDERRRPTPRWAKHTLRTGFAATIFGIALGGPAWLWQAGWVASATNSLFSSASQVMANAGFRVEEILLQGRRYESSDRIMRVLNIKRGAPLLSVDIETARRNLERLPWVRVASVERELPNTIRVKIVERQPLALWQRENELVLVDDEGTVITSKKPDRFHNLLVLVGKDAPSHATSLLSILSQEPALKRRVNAAVRIGERRWNIRMDNGVFVRLPEDNALKAWRRFARLERQHKLLKQDLLSIDLRLPNQLIVRTRAGRPETDRKVIHRKGKNT